MQPLSPHQMQIRLLGRLAGPLLAIVHSGMSQVGESHVASLVGAKRTTCRTHLRQPEEIEDALDALKGYGIGEPTRSQVLSLSWVTAELIEDWRRALDEAPGPGKWSAGLLIHRLRSGEDPPPSKADRTRQRYSEEAYADFINH